MRENYSASHLLANIIIIVKHISYIKNIPLTSRSSKSASPSTIIYSYNNKLFFWNFDGKQQVSSVPANIIP